MTIFKLGAFLIVSMISPLYAHAALSLNGTNYLCKNASYMQLWDIASSSLVKHQMLLEEHCWKPMKGIHVEVLDVIGKFSRVQYVGNGIVAYAYTNDIKEVRPQKPTLEPEKIKVIRLTDKLKRVNSLTDKKEVMLLKGKPTVNFYFSAGRDCEIQITLTKESLKSGLNLKVQDQKNGAMEVGVKYKKLNGGLGPPDYVTFEILERNDEKKYIDVRIGGYWNKLDIEKNIDLEIKPATIRISGAQFVETVRPHTPKELKNPFKDYFGETT